MVLDLLQFEANSLLEASTLPGWAFPNNSSTNRRSMGGLFLQSYDYLVYSRVSHEDFCQKSFWTQVQGHLHSCTCWPLRRTWASLWSRIYPCRCHASSLSHLDSYSVLRNFIFVFSASLPNLILHPALLVNTFSSCPLSSSILYSSHPSTEKRGVVEILLSFYVFLKCTHEPFFIITKAKIRLGKIEEECLLEAIPHCAACVA